MKPLSFPIHLFAIGVPITFFALLEKIAVQKDYKYFLQDLFSMKFIKKEPSLFIKPSFKKIIS